MNSTWQLRRLSRADMAEAARVHRASFDDRLPSLAGLHTPDEDEAFFGRVVFDACDIWGSFDGPKLVGFIAFRAGWIDQLYVLPGRQSRGMGSALLSLAQGAHRELDLWTFQRNEAAIRFYERRGFIVVERTDGERNAEREADVRLRWRFDAI